MALKAGHRDRIGKVTGSLMYPVSGKATPEETNEAFFRCIGAKQHEVTYAMRAGEAMEPVMIDHVERQLGQPIVRRQDEVSLPSRPDDVFVTLDGMIGQHTLTEFKFCAPGIPTETLFYRYYDQVALGMMCTGAPRGVIYVGVGTAEPYEIECIRDPSYEDDLRERIDHWLACVRTGTPPCPVPPPKPPPERFRTVDLLRDCPNWGGALMDHLIKYDETKDAADEHTAAGKAARALVPDDVGKVIAGVWRIGRDKRGFLSIRRSA